MRNWIATALALAVGAGSAGLARAEGAVDWYGDFRFRLEQDWDSKRANGRERDDRGRARIRARLGLKYTHSNVWELGFRIRTGSDDSQQSPHITVADFSGNSTGDEDLNLDKWYAKWSGESAWVWAGRNSYPFWKQNELFWDDDVTPIGIAAQGGHGQLKFTGGFFLLPAGMQDDSGEMIGGQIAYNAEQFTAAVGYYSIDADPDDPDNALYLQGNGSRDYGLFQAHLQYRTEAGGRPLKFGFDYSHNDEDYGPDDPIAFANRDATDAFVLSVLYGGTGKVGDWLAGYYYADVEQFAVNSSFSQDDWMRWGSATQTRSSNFDGHELRYAYRWTQRLTAVARLYLVESLTSVEDGNRFRVDFNWSF